MRPHHFVLVIIIAVVCAGSAYAVYRHYFPPRNEYSYQEGYSDGIRKDDSPLGQSNVSCEDYWIDEVNQLWQQSSDKDRMKYPDWLDGCNDADSKAHGN
jgi:hypothetical protein